MAVARLRSQNKSASCQPSHRHCLSSGTPGSHTTLSACTSELKPGTFCLSNRTAGVSRYHGFTQQGSRQQSIHQQAGRHSPRLCAFVNAIMIITRLSAKRNHHPVDIFFPGEASTERLGRPRQNRLAWWRVGRDETHRTSSVKRDLKVMRECLQVFSRQRPTWGTCVGMILLAEGAGAPAVIENGQSLFGGCIDITVRRDYFSSQISSFERALPAPPDAASIESFPGVFIWAPAILL
jgi:hypothetical protein